VHSICGAMGEDVSRSPPQRIRQTPISIKESTSHSPPRDGIITGGGIILSGTTGECPLTLNENVDSEGKDSTSGVGAEAKPSSLAFRAGWRTMVGYYFNEVLNFPECMEQTYGQLVDRITYQTSIPREKVESILNELIERASSTTDYGMPGIRTTYLENVVIVQIGMLSFKMARTHHQRLLKFTSSEGDSLVRLLLRYYPLGTGGGFFWSIDPSIYEWLEGSLPLLECFASPFNYNTQTWCSPFESDRCYGSQGNFFNYIEDLKKPMRLVVNPPYTQQMLERTTKAVLSYLQRVEGAEAILTYPCWNYLECYRTLNEWPNSSSIQVERGGYSLYDYSSGRRIITPMSLTFFILASPGHAVSFNAEMFHTQVLKVASVAEEERETFRSTRYNPTPEGAA